jgi:TP901 family phage tail tape measure protein
MSDLKILLTADLNVAQSTRDINAAIAKIQEKITKLKLQIDTKALKDAGVLIKGINENASKFNNAAAKSAQAAQRASEQGTKTVKKNMDSVKEFQRAIDRVNSEIGKSNPKSWSITKNAKGEVKKATVTYTNEMGKTIKKNFEWVSKTAGDVTTKTFKQVSENVVNSSSQAAKKMQQLYNQAGKLKYDLTTGKTKVFDSAEAQKLITSYDVLQNKIQSAQANGHTLRAKTLKGIEEEIAKNKTLTDEIVRQQKAYIKTHNTLGRTVVGDSSGLNINSSASSIIGSALPKINSYMASSGLGGTASASNFNLDHVKINSAGKAVATLNAQIDIGNGKFANFKVKVDEASNSTRIFSQKITEAKKANLSFMDQLKTAMSRIPIWMIGMTAFYQSLHFFTDGIAYVNDFNKALTQLSIVFNQSQSEVEKYSKQFYELGMAMSISTEEIANGAVEFARQGLKGAEMMDKMRVATMYAKISNMDFNQSAQILTATVNSMGVSAERAADIYSYMGDATATGADEIGVAMQKVGGTAGAIGLEFEKVSSWIATISSRTRESASTIGNSVKSIIARVQSLRENGFDEEDGTQVNQVSKALAQVGIQLIDTQGNFRNFGTVMDELGAKWGSLTNRQKNYLATTVAGSYQQSRFLNIMEGYPESVALYEASLDSAGTATEKFNKYQEGTEAHLTRMKNAWNEIFQSSFDSEGIRNVIDMITTLGQTINSAVEQFGLFPIVLGIATTAALIFSKAFRTGIYGAMIPSVALFKKISYETQFLGLRLKEAAVSMTTTAGAINVLKVSLNGLKIALAAVTPMLVIFAAGFAIQKVIEMVQKHKEAVKELKTVNYSLRDSYMEQRTGLKALRDEYNTLMATEDKTIEQKNRLLDIQNELVKTYGVTATGVDAEGNSYVNSQSAIEDRIEILTDLIKVQNELNKAKVVGNYSDNTKNINDKKASYEENQKALLELQEQEKEYLNGKKTRTVNVPTSFGETVPVEVETDIEEINRAKTKVLTELEKSKSELDSATADRINAIKVEYNTRLEEAGKSVTNEQRKFAETLADVVGQMDGQSFITFDGQVDYLEDYYKKLEEIGVRSTDQLKSLFVDNGIEYSTDNVMKFKEILNVLSTDQYKNMDITEKQTKIYDQFASQIGLSSQTFSKIVEAMSGGEKVFPEIADDAKNAGVNINSFATSLDALKEKYDDTSSVVQSLNGLLQANAEGKALSADTVMDLIAKDSSLVSMFKIENGVIKMNTKAVEEKRLALIQAVRDEGVAQRQSVISQNSALVAKLEAYGIEVNAIQSVGEALDIINTKTAQMVYLARKMNEGDLVESLTEDGKTLADFVKTLEDLKNQAQFGADSLEILGDATEETTESVTKLQKAINDVDSALDKLNSQQQMYAKSSKEYRESVRKEIKLLEDKKKLLLEAAKNPSLLVPATTTTTNSTFTSTNFKSGTGVKSSGNIKDIITQAANNNGVDASILDAIAWAESSYNPNAKSGAGAAGLMQLMPKTAKGLGVTNVYDPTQSANGGAKYLSQMYDKYGSYELALAAYNAGPGYVDWAMKVTGSKDWNVLKNAKADTAKLNRSVGDNIFKSETLNYVPKVVDYAQKGSGAKSSNTNTTSSTKTTSTTTNTKDSKAIEDASKNIEKQLIDVDAEIFAGNRDILDSYLAQYENQLASKDESISQSDYKMARLDPNSPKYNTELKNQITQLEAKQKLMHDEAELIRNSGIESDDLTQKTLELSQAWRDAQDQITAINDQMADNSLIKYEESISSINNELSMSTARLATYDQESKEYRNEIQKQIAINQKLKKATENEATAIRAILKENEKSHKLSVEQVNNYKNKLKELSITWWDIEGAIVQSTNALKDFNENVADKAIDLLKEMYEKQKDAIIDAIEEQDEALEKAHEKEMDRIDEKLEADQKIIDSKIKQLEFDKSENDYQKSLNDKIKERQELQDKINRLSMDDSREGKAQLKTLLEQRNDIDEQIQGMKDDHSLEAQKTDLENQKTALEEKAEAEKEAWTMSVELWDAKTQQMVTITGKSYDEMKDIIEDYKDNANDYFENIANNEIYWSNLKKDIESGNITEIQSKLGGLKGWFDTNLPLLGQTIYDNVTVKLKEVIDNLKMIRNEASIVAEMQANSAKWATATSEEKKALEAANNALGESIGATKTSGGVWLDSNGNPLYGGTATSSNYSSVIAQMKANAQEWHTASKDRQKELVALNEKLGASIGLTKKADGHWYDKSGVQVLHKGGIVGGNGNALTKTVEQFMNTDANEQVVLALKDELMSPSTNIQSKFIPNLGKLVSSLGSNVVTTGGNTYNINIDSVIGDEKGADTVASRIVNAIKKLGQKR